MMSLLRSCSRAALTTACMAAVLSIPTFASAQGSSNRGLSRVLVLEATRQGTDPAAARQALAEMRPVFSEAGVTLEPGRDASCLDDPDEGCVSVLEANGADAVLVVTWDPAGSERPRPIVGLYLLRGEQQLALNENVPEDAEAQTLLYQTLVAQALGRWGVSENTELTINGSPPGAAVQLGRTLGRIPFTTSVPPGPYELTVRAPAFQPHAETIQVPSQPEYTLSVHLEPIDGDDEMEEDEDEEREAPSSGTPWQRIAGPVMVGVGVAGAAGVVVGSILATGDDAVPNGSESTDVRWGPTLAYAGVGAAVAIAGVILWVTAPDADTAVAVGSDRITLRQRF